MHREIQIKQFPIVTTHWWPKTRNERFVWENEQYLYRFLPLVHNHGWRLRWRLKSCVSTTLQTRPPSSVDADAPCECSVSQSARTHTSHTGCVCALRSLGHGCVQEVKNDINTVRFLTQTTRFVVLGHQCVVPMGNCLIWISLCMLFPSYRDSDLYLPLYDWQTRTVLT